ncbi:ribonucleotide reductase small subunit 1 [Orgyia leucostigma nucleopolyhedrovirus]|uniref:Ribonucleoside-diphosphate reductase n=1 Tax=Orgyia leucostigma nucleopolyhedrovirus TaxID=490711 RepID=B0FE03_9ABAC|nr:ribonucleotide reductase small subunit 1 [Orgyia leucostigma nucleopolyhedrovirus]ABY65861.1 ribonucleotide reductase small subunit 1 [Orgyia leucostigma nucleopolyhedrovirus]
MCAARENKLYVIKRDGSKQTVLLDKITSKLNRLSYGLNKQFIDPAAITIQVVKTIYAGVTTTELDQHAAKETANMAYIHDDYALLAGRIMVDDNHKHVPDSFVRVVAKLYKHNLVSLALFEVASANADALEAQIDYKRDYEYKYFAYKTLENGYLKRINGRVAERIQHMLMRVAIGIHGRDIDAAIETYNLTANKMFTHASPTLFAAGCPQPQLSSCFLLTLKEDSIKGMYETLADCAQISKYGGGLGVNVHKARARGSAIRGTNGTASGVEPLLRVYNNCVRHVDQGGKRKGAMAVYLEPWHADIYDFLNLKRNMGAEDKKARDLLYALWVPDLFMKRVQQNEMWSLMCPDRCPGLSDVYSLEFEKLYEQYESENRFTCQVEARSLFRTIIETQVETGTPYILYKDACNIKSNQKNLGTIRCSNLCAEIVQYSSSEEIAVCNLASVCVNRFIKSGVFDFVALKSVTKIVVKNLNKIIDINYYPLEAAKESNLKHRPVGVGIQGLADAFCILGLPYESDKAKMLNKQIAETVYYAALEASCDLAKLNGPYSSYSDSPASLGVLQYDMWNVQPTNLWNWADLKLRIAKHGLRNSLLVAYMPTATTAQILGNNESFEPFTSNLYVRRVLAGDFQVINQHLVEDLCRLNLYDDHMRNSIIAAGGSVQKIDRIPDDIKAVYKTVWEMSSKNLIDMAADRGAFIDQSQSFNVFIAQPSFALLTSVHMHTWKRGLKTGMYYLRTKPAADAIAFTVDKCSIECRNCSA